MNMMANILLTCPQARRAAEQCQGALPAQTSDGAAPQSSTHGREHSEAAESAVSDVAGSSPDTVSPVMDEAGHACSASSACDGQRGTDLLRGGDSAAHVDESMLADCVVCWDNAASVVLQPCGHMCACSGCALLLLHPLSLGSCSCTLWAGCCGACRAVPTQTYASCLQMRQATAWCFDLEQGSCADGPAARPEQKSCLQE